MYWFFLLPRGSCWDTDSSQTPSWRAGDQGAGTALWGPACSCRRHRAERQHPRQGPNAQPRMRRGAQTSPRQHRDDKAEKPSQLTEPTETSQLHVVHGPGWLCEEEKVPTRGTKTMAKLNAESDNITSRSIIQFLKFSDYQRLIAHLRRQPEAFRGRGHSVSNSFSNSSQNIRYVYTHTHILVPGKGKES